MLKFYNDRKFNFTSFTTEEIMCIIRDGELIKKIAQVAMTKTVSDKVNSDKEGSILREMTKLIEDMVDGFSDIKNRKEADDKRRKELGVSIHGGH